MRIAFPVNEDRGLDSPVHDHFGTAERFIIVNADDRRVQSIENADRDHEHGRCQPLAAFSGVPVDAVVVGGIGAGALHRLADGGVQAFRAVEGTVADNLNLIALKRLPAFPRHHTCDGDCHH